MKSECCWQEVVYMWVLYEGHFVHLWCWKERWVTLTPNPFPKWNLEYSCVVSYTLKMWTCIAQRMMKHIRKTTVSVREAEIQTSINITGTSYHKIGTWKLQKKEVWKKLDKFNHRCVTAPKWKNTATHNTEKIINIKVGSKNTDALYCFPS